MEQQEIDNVGRILAYEARALARKMERKAQRLAEAAERKIINHEVIETNDDDRRGDLMSLILNAKPDGWTDRQWFLQLEAWGGCKADTYQRWRDMTVKNPTGPSERITLQVLGLGVFYGRRV